MPLAQIADRTETQCCNDLPGFTGVSHCVAKEYVCESMRRFAQEDEVFYDPIDAQDEVFYDPIDAQTGSDCCNDNDSDKDQGRRMGREAINHPCKVLEGADAAFEMKSAIDAEAFREFDTTVALKLGRLPDVTRAGAGRIHDILKEESQAIKQQRDLYVARLKAQECKERRLEEWAAKLAALQETWREEVARQETEGDVWAWMQDETSRHERELQRQLHVLEIEKDAALDRLRVDRDCMTAQMRHAREEYEAKIAIAQAEHRQLQESMEALINEREHFESETQRRRLRADRDLHKIRRNQKLLESAEAGLQQQLQELRDQERRLLLQQDEVEEQRREFQELQASLGFEVGLPVHWASSSKSGELNLFRVTDPVIRDLLEQSLLCEKAAEWLGTGADVRETGDYNYIALCEAWSVQNLPLWYKYCLETGKMRSEISECGLPLSSINIRSELHTAASQLPGPCLRDDINEVFLVHGTDSAATVHSLVRDGFNERFNGRANFGYGSYLAEDAGKCDQYLAKDACYDPQECLHQVVFESPPTSVLEPCDHGGADRPQHPGDIYWMVLVRAAIGHAAVSVDGVTESVTGGDVWAQARKRAQKRELAHVANTTSKMRFHSLVVETSDPALFDLYRHRRVYRYREFVFPHSERLYPEYLLAVRREKR